MIFVKFSDIEITNKRKTFSALIRDQNINVFRCTVSVTEFRAPQVFRTLKTFTIVWLVTEIGQNLWERIRGIVIVVLCCSQGFKSVIVRIHSKIPHRISPSSFGVTTWLYIPKFYVVSVQLMYNICLRSCDPQQKLSFICSEISPNFTFFKFWGPGGSKKSKISKIRFGMCCR